SPGDDNLLCSQPVTRIGYATTKMPYPVGRGVLWHRKRNINRRGDSTHGVHIRNVLGYYFPAGGVPIIHDTRWPVTQKMVAFIHRVCGAYEIAVGSRNNGCIIAWTDHAWFGSRKGITVLQHGKNPSPTKLTN